MSKRITCCTALAILQLLTSPVAAQPTPAVEEPLQFNITFDPSLQSTPYTGRVYVVLSTTTRREPRQAIMNWFNPPQTLALDVSNWNTAEPIQIGAQALANPQELHELKPMEYSVQAIARRSLDYPVPGQGPNDLYSDPQTLRLNPATSGIVALRLNHVVEEKTFAESERIKYVEIDSPLLSKFHGRSMKMRAGVILPQGWSDDSQRTYPVLYWIGGFGGDHHFAARMPGMDQGMGAGELGDRVLRVVPDPICFRGHTVFADSENNGPWGQAFIEELIPAVERKFRGAQSGKHRYVTGISSGGWSSLWLQVTYPEQFAGCWSHVPDPVDFRDFQQINLYAPDTNMFVDQSGNKRPLARGHNGVALFYEEFVRMEEVLGPGGQIQAFEAVFSRRTKSGAPAPLFDRATGKIDLAVAKSWEKYDISLILQRNWSRLEPLLKGKLHIYAGQYDTFYLEGAVAKLKQALSDLGSDAEVEVVPGMSHAFHREKIRPMYEQILSTFDRASQPPAGKSD